MPALQLRNMEDCLYKTMDTKHLKRDYNQKVTVSVCVNRAELVSKAWRM